MAAPVARGPSPAIVRIGVMAFENALQIGSLVR